MKKVIGIYCGEMSYNGKEWDSNVVRNEGCGGSETWTVELSTEFVRLGFYVIVFCKCKNWHFDEYGVEYVPYWMLEHRCTYQYFDYFISSRVINGIIDELECPNVYIMCHEYGIFDTYWGNFADYDQIKMGRIKKIAVLSGWNMDETIKTYPKLKEENFFITYNGVKDDLYKDVDSYEKKNKMVWSSCLNRGLTFFGRHVIPKIKDSVPDFEVDICSYMLDIHGEIPKYEWTHFLGALEKNEMSRRQKESKLWIIPNYGFNDFGQKLQESCPLTGIENMLSKNAVICFNKGGVKTMFSGYTGMMNADEIDSEIPPTEEELDRLGTRVANEAIRILKDDEYRASLVNELNVIKDKYTWKNSARTWLKEWGLIYE